MDQKTKDQLFEKNQRIIKMVVEKIQRDFPDDIGIVGLTGSFATGDFTEKSDLDLIIINDTDRGWGISDGFILGDVGYDIYCTPWDTRIKDQSELRSPGVSSLTEMQILYAATQEHLARLCAYQQKARDLLAQPIGADSIERAKEDIAMAKQEYADAMLAQEIGSVRYAVGGVLYHAINALMKLNNRCFTRGIKRYIEQLRTLPFLPERFETQVFEIIDADTIAALRAAALRLLEGVVSLHARLKEETVKKPVPTHESLWGTYEELWCNCRNKVLQSVAAKDKAFAFFAAIGAQNYLDEMETNIGTPHFNLMRDFDAQNLAPFQESFLRAMDDYLREYEKVGREVNRFEAFEDLYDAYMSKKVAP